MSEGDEVTAVSEDRKPTSAYGSTEFLVGIDEEVRSSYVRTTDLRTFLEATEKITLGDMQMIAEQALVLLEMFYVHMPLKRAMYAIDPVQRLRLLNFHLKQVPEEQKVDSIRFHKEMTKIFTSLHDLHTRYILPAHFRYKTAFLPFLIEEYYEGKQRKFIISKTASWFSHPTFKIGVEVTYWNGIPIESAIELNADRQGGSNLEAQHARGLNNMTIRPLSSSLPPDEEWVVIGYISPDGEKLELKQNWLVTSPNSRTGAVDPNLSTMNATALGIDIKSNEIQQMKKLLFAPNTIVAEKKISKGELLYATPSVGLETCMPGVFKTKTVETPDGNFGYIRIYTFDVDSDDKFVSEFIRLIELLPQNGLIVDVRGNSGGLILAGERLLQLFTPHKINPEPAQFINTPLTYDLCYRHSQDLNLFPWVESMRQAVQTGSTYSQSFPITSEKACNSIGQKYLGPVILITDALCYSATDIFAGGFQDNEIGPILGTDMNTGAGGANVWTQEKLLDLIGYPLKPLPNGSGMLISMRRTLRVLGHEGMQMEDLGVVPNYKHDMTEDDVLNDNVDLINHAASILAKMPIYKISASVTKLNGKISVNTATENISRLDVYLDDRPQRSVNIVNNAVEFLLELPETDSLFIELQGFKDNNLVAIRRVEI